MLVLRPERNHNGPCPNAFRTSAKKIANNELLIQSR
jgi:hypothetical protein